MSKKYLFFIIVFAIIITAYFLIRSNQKRVSEENQPTISQNKTKTESNQISQPQFLGEKGESVELVNGRVSITANVFNDNLAHYYHVKLSDGKTVYFFIIKDGAGIYRAAANACQVCFNARMGFRQEGDYMVCNTCGNKYPLEKIATEKGGCNPGPINPNLKIQSENIIVEQQDLEQVAELF